MKHQKARTMRCLICVLIVGFAIAEDYTKFVDTRIGTGVSHNGELGNTFPATGVPFGNTHLTPQTTAGEHKCKSPYYATQDEISGFRMSHWISGSCMQDYGSMSVMPLSHLPQGDISDEAVLAQNLTRESEVAMPHYYSVNFTSGVQAELTGASHCGVMRFTFPARTGYLVLKPNSDRGEGVVQFDPESRQANVSNPAHRIYAGYGKGAGFSGHHIVTVRAGPAITSFGTIRDGNVTQGGTSVTGHGKPVGLLLGLAFPTTHTPVVELSICHSFTSFDMAATNMDSEIAGLQGALFESVKNVAHDKWNNVLANVEVNVADLTASNLTVLYSALYHTMLLPREFSDIDFKHIRFASNSSYSEIIQSDRPFYTDYSQWDTFRGVMPLLSIVQPQKFREVVLSALDMYQEGGWLPVFPCWNQYTNEMIGDHLAVTLTEAAVKGHLSAAEMATAWAAVKQNVFETPSAEEINEGKGRRSGDVYRKFGYLPVDISTGRNNQVSMTLEYAYDDYIAAKLAQLVNDTESYKLLMASSENWRNVWDKESGFVRGKYSNGSWVTPFDPYAGGPSTHHPPPPYITEASPYEYTWFVPHNIKGLIEIMGGEAKFLTRLEDFMSNNYFDKSNEPDLQVPFLSPYAHSPSVSQRYLRDIYQSTFTPDPSGLPGNDDAGAMSAWGLMAYAGLYSICPGAEWYILSAPLVPQITFHSDAASFTITANNLSEANMYIQSATLNGAKYDMPYLMHESVVTGGELVVEMGPNHDSAWGTGHTPPAC